MSQVQETKNLAGILKLAVLSVVSLCLASCGGGGGDGDSASKEPAPQTMNGIVFRLLPGAGPVLTLIRSEGDALVGNETGNVTMAPNPGSIPVADTNNNPVPELVSPIISATTYSYTRTSPEGGRLVISGRGLNFIPGSVPQTPYAYFGGNFSRTYELIFATDGVNVTAVATVDFDTANGLAGGAIYFGNSSVRLFGGGIVPIGWTVERSSTLSLPKLFPGKLSGETMDLLLSGPPIESQRFLFLESTFTRFTPDIPGNFLEKGSGNLFVGDSPDPIKINYEYQPDPTTNNKAILRISRGDPGPSQVIYEFTFISLKTGNVSINNIPAGTFDFLFL